jgi:hypothetical protein
MVGARTVERARWVTLLAPGGFVGNFVLCVCDHARSGLVRPEEWTGVVAAAAAAGALVAILIIYDNRPLLRLGFAVMPAQVAVGLLGASWHVRADPGRPMGTLWQKFLYGAPVFAPLIPAGRASGPREGLERRGLGLVDRDDQRQVDGLGPHADVLVHVAEPDRPPPLLGLFHHLEEGRISHAAEVASPAQVEKERPGVILADDLGQLADEFLGPVGPLDIQAQDLDDHDVSSPPQAEMLEALGDQHRPSPAVRGSE